MSFITVINKNKLYLLNVAQIGAIYEPQNGEKGSIVSMAGDNGNSYYYFEEVSVSEFCEKLKEFKQ